ncbi:unnamed protein product [Meganyctiphanes norvegica]|uniref:Pectinesterase inhibitor domain-containing protein n=1 Tax=Meganyctiphanes norvegica TaxID=48144 RepID=A0AAV2RCG0_MEGNR
MNHPRIFICMILSALCITAQSPDALLAITTACGHLDHDTCMDEAMVCIELLSEIQDKFKSTSAGISCAGEQGIGLFALIGAQGEGKTNKEVLRDAGADDETFRAIEKCVLISQGFANDSALIMHKVTDAFQEVIEGHLNDNATLLNATLEGINSCPEPPVNGIRDYSLCVTNACVTRAHEIEEELKTLEYKPVDNNQGNTAEVVRLDFFILTLCLLFYSNNEYFE